MHNLSTDGAYCGVSRGELNWSPFDPELLARNIAMREQGAPAVPLHPGRCGPCEDCQEYRGAAGPRPASAGLEAFVRHAERFGSELVVETARTRLTLTELAKLEGELALLGRRNGGRPVETRQRRTSSELRRQVAALRERGLVPLAIADALNISDRRCRKLLADLAHNQSGARDPSVQAEVHAAKASGHVVA